MNDEQQKPAERCEKCGGPWDERCGDWLSKGKPKCGKHHKGPGGCDFGLLWAAGWLFTIGFLKLGFWKSALAIIIWAYYLGAHFAR